MRGRTLRRAGPSKTQANERLSTRHRLAPRGVVGTFIRIDDRPAGKARAGVKALCAAREGMRVAVMWTIDEPKVYSGQYFIMT
jgi:hypothetical protein